MLKTIQPLLLKVDILKEIKKLFDVEYSLVITPKVRFDETSPSLAPSKEIMKFCYETDTEIVYDLYVCCPETFNEGMVWKE